MLHRPPITLRTSRFLVLVPLRGRDSLTVPQTVIAATGSLPASIKHSTTWDFGSEMALHADDTELLEAGAPFSELAAFTRWES